MYFQQNFNFCFPRISLISTVFLCVVLFNASEVQRRGPGRLFPPLFGVFFLPISLITRHYFFGFFCSCQASIHNSYCHWLTHFLHSCSPPAQAWGAIERGIARGLLSLSLYPMFPARGGILGNWAVAQNPLSPRLCDVLGGGAAMLSREWKDGVERIFLFQKLFQQFSHSNYTCVW